MPESISILITDSTVPHESPKVLTGDTLFIGDVGRPDLAGSRGFTALSNVVGGTAAWVAAGYPVESA